jgi:hypothetical protein
MSMHAASMVEVTHWERSIIHELDGAAPLVRVRFAHAFTGDITGEGLLEYLMLERPDATTSFVGLERVIGRLAGRNGTFVLEHTGAFQQGRAQVAWRVMPDSGTGDLRGLRGAGGFVTGHAMRYPVTLDYEID